MANGSRTVSVIDGDNNTLVENIVVGSILIALLFNPSNNNMYVTSTLTYQSLNISVIH